MGGKTGDFEAVRQDIIKLLHQPEYDDGSAGPVLVRLAWHSAGTYDAETDTGGSNGAGMRYEAEGGDPANADLWTLAGVVAIKEMGGPEIPWLGGRTDYVDDSKLPPRGRLPDGAKGADHLRWIFYRMGFNDQEIVALSGAHNLGRCHSDRSGFEGQWVNNPTRFSNQYFRLMLSMQWKKKTLKNGVEQFVNYDEDSGTELMMLPTDIALTQDKAFIKYVELYARDKEAFFAAFTKVFAKLIELGITRDADGNITNSDNELGGYHAAPKKKATPGSPAKSTDDKVDPSEAEPLKEENTRFRARL
ncbi:putative heme-binding peroxidase [Glarea lozoyensis 74030]|uniref:Peroxidase n=1 Tax=Glarea lozoyensis (strain ATCC 74030 / MF5533) TaxID=1104152 RepID=H0ENN6_GLAL7|nr:putative heme-binding peroxidase [Glarea lozoyensis 74030]